jgi:hypothetical protein
MKAGRLAAPLFYVLYFDLFQKGVIAFFLKSIE